MSRRAPIRKPTILTAAQTATIPTTIKSAQRVAHRRMELIQVATKLFLQKGFHNTSIRDIVCACSFNIASLYMYVSSKEDVLYLVAQDLINHIASELGETKLAPGRPKQSLMIGFASYCRIIDRLRRPIRLLYREVGSLSPELRAQVLGTVADVVTYFQKIIEEGVEQGVFRPQATRVAALQVMFTAHMIALHTSEIYANATLDDFIAVQTEALLSGLLAKNGRRNSAWRSEAGASRLARPAKAHRRPRERVPLPKKADAKRRTRRPGAHRPADAAAAKAKIEGGARQTGALLNPKRGQITGPKRR